MFFFNRKSNENKNDISNKSIIDKIEEIEPFAEADVYIAYGRKSQALTILQSALKDQKITKEQYNNFIKTHNLEEEKRVNFEKVEKNTMQYKYYISFTAGNEKSTIRQRVLIQTKNSIYTEAGIKEIEKYVENIIKSIFIDSLFTTTWTLDSYIELNIE